MSPFAIRDFRLLYSGRFAGTFGTQIVALALAWQVYQLTHDPFAIGLIGLCQFLPSLVLVLFAGEVADKYDRRYVMGASYLLCLTCAAIIAGFTWFGTVTPPLIYAVAAGLGITRIFGSPAANALLPNVVPPSLFSKAIALNATAFQLATICGPGVAGLLLLVSAKATYSVAALLLGIAAASSFALQTPSQGVKRPMTLESLAAGILFIRQRPVLLGAISLDLFSVLLGGVVALLPIYAKDILHGNADTLGYLRSAPALGAALMAAMLGWRPLLRHAGAWLFGSVTLFALATVAFGVSTSLPLSLLLLVLLGAADMVSVYIRNHLMQKNTPDAMRGRVASVSLLFITTSNELGDFESGMMASWIGSEPAVVVGGVLALVVAGLIAWRVPSLRRLDRLDEKQTL